MRWNCILAGAPGCFLSNLEGEMLVAVLLVGYVGELVVGPGERAAEAIAVGVLEYVGLFAALARGGSEREACG